jgi:hypothetical protein
MNERELLRKLVTKWHLSVPERKQLTNRAANVSILLDIIAEIVLQHGWYPQDWRPEQDFAGYLIELLQDGSCLVHHQEEVAVMRYEHLGTVVCNSPLNAAKQWLQEMYPHDIDGVPLDWSEQ